MIDGSYALVSMGGANCAGACGAGGCYYVAGNFVRACMCKRTYACAGLPEREIALDGLVLAIIADEVRRSRFAELAVDQLAHGYHTL